METLHKYLGISKTKAKSCPKLKKTGPKPSGEN
jgi:hypothetical protein